MQVTIIIVNWNAGNLLAEAITSISEYHQGLVASIIIVDNASSDDSLSRIEAIKKFPCPLKIIRNLENIGFAAACNQGATIASTPYLLFLNPDTRLYENSLDTPLSFMANPENAKIGICGIQLINESGQVDRSCARFPSLQSITAHAIGLNRIILPLEHFMSEWDHMQTRQVDQVIGAFFLVRRDLFEKLRGFDERFFVYFEEVDFSFRAYHLGWQSVYVADAQAFHAGGGTSKQVKAARLFYSIRSRLLYGFKHFSPAAAWAVLAVTILLEPISRIVFSVVRASWRDAFYTLQGYRMLLQALPSTLRTATRKN
ncbi:MAG: glycosyltransferase family 2 protein [Methylococcaceae bacterium]|nr:glycosyltransferase family 2 protein [Methylococcaceae bacterium]MDZ4156084.1 glycosyltransferase family 2 protein [Methylococcales bacterium]MDP2395097.1 glycosyltransferase family 2 protein [Methylococcaceae bacterium]MDP3018761.1 glycosyltransferase family 2 protein [Methylococcaceae bacterium]MDP3390522.1 glycosyltransferase family 2 protein [Methylococcaceae bacterium]